MIERKYFKIMEKELDNKQITALLGSRQVGKTTIMEYIFEKVKEKATFITFEEPEILDLFENNQKLFIQRYIEPFDYIFIDEIQYSQNSGKTLKLIYDKFKKKIFISGSSTPQMSINSLQYLVGRVNIFEIYPLDFKEFIKYKSENDLMLFNQIRTQKESKLIENYFQEYTTYGGYPQVVLKETYEEKEKELNNLIKTYLLKEIKEILNFKNIFEFDKLLKRFALSDGKICNKSSISSEIDINRVKFNEMFSTLISTYIFEEVKGYYSNKIKELIKSSKIYFSDIGFKNSLIKNFNPIELRSDKGEIYESFILSVIKRNNFETNFWNLKNKTEIDFIIEKNDKKIGFEIKSNITSDNIYSSIEKFVEMEKPYKVYIFNNKIDSVRKIKNVEIVFTNYINIYKILETEFSLKTTFN